MSKMRINRYTCAGALGIGIALGAIATIGACSDSITSPPVPDSATPVTRNKAEFYVFNDSPNLYPFRLCFKYQNALLDLPPLPSDGTKSMPLSNFPGIAEGAAVALPAITFDTEDKGSSISIDVFAVRARLVLNAIDDAGARCPTLVCDHGSCLEKGPDYIFLGQVSFALGEPNMLIVTGCAPSGVGSTLTDTSICGTNYEPTRGNLSAKATAIGSSRSRAGTLVKFVDIHNGDAPAKWQTGTASTTLSSQFVAVALPSSLSGYATSGIAFGSNESGDAGLDGEGGARGPTFFSLANVQDLSDPASVPNAFFTDGQYVFAALGSLSMGSAINADGTRNTTHGALRIVALRLSSP